MDQFMERAVELAIDNVREGGQPFGAVLVKDNEIVAEGVNELHKTFDISGHAELLAIRRAQQQLQTHDLSGYTMYASGEPCAMCLTAMYFAGIEKDNKIRCSCGMKNYDLTLYLFTRLEVGYILTSFCFPQACLLTK